MKRDKKGKGKVAEKPPRAIVRVRDAMHTEFDCMDGMTTTAEAMKRLQYPQTKAIIINKRHENDEYGIVMVSDIGRKVLAHGKSAKRVNLYELMSKPYVTVPPTMDVRYCARLFEQFKLARVPVLDATGEIVGIVSFTDLVMKGMLPQLDD